MSVTAKINEELFPPALQGKFSGIGEAVILGAGEIFQQKCKPSLEFLGIRTFHIFDPVKGSTSMADVLDASPASCPVFVLSPNQFHCQQASSLIASGRTIFLEKPIVTDLVELDMLHAAISARILPNLYCADYYLQKALPLRHYLGIRASCGSLEAGLYVRRGVVGNIGKIVHIEGRLHEAGGIGQRRWLAQAGGGMLLDLMTHFVNIMELLGFHIQQLTSVQLSDRSGLLRNKQQSDEGAKVEGYCADGVAFVLSAGKYFTARDRYLTFYSADGRWVRLEFGTVNTLATSDGITDELTTEPYLLAVYEFLELYSGGGRGPVYWEEQCRTVKILSQIQDFYWKNTV